MKARRQIRIIMAGRFTVLTSFVLLGFTSPSFAAPQLLAFEDLFPEPFFSDDNKKTGESSLFSSSTAPEQKKDAPPKPSQSPESREADNVMRQQIGKVSSWLQEFSMRNHGDFPGVYSDSNTPARASQVQLTELVGASPYANSSPSSPPVEELNGLTPGLSSIYSSDGSPAPAAPTATDEWTSEFQAQQLNRVLLGMDYSITGGAIEQWRNDPPDDWQAAPGTIVAKGNYQGLFYVWGAGQDGKPVKDFSGKKAYILGGRTSSTVGDQIAPNSGQ